MRTRSKKLFFLLTVAVLISAGVVLAASLVGKLYVKTTEVLLTERSGLPCTSAATNYCDRTYMCPLGQTAYALVYNLKEENGHKFLSGLGLVCSDPNALDQPETVGAGGDAFAGEVVKDYCPVGYMVAGAEFHTADQLNLTGARRVCRRYHPYDEHRGATLFGEGFDFSSNVCADHHWVTGVKMSFERKQTAAGRIDTRVLNARFYCGEMRQYLVEPERDDERTPQAH
jgi:hypothetical protein